MPKKCTPYLSSENWKDNTTTLVNAFNEVVQGFKDNEYDAAFVYYVQIDTLGHGYGPDSSRVHSEVKAVDEVIKQFLENLSSENLDDSTNFVVVSDHGMSSNFNRVSLLPDNSQFSSFSPASTKCSQGLITTLLLLIFLFFLFLDFPFSSKRNLWTNYVIMTHSCNSCDCLKTIARIVDTVVATLCIS